MQMRFHSAVTFLSPLKVKRLNPRSSLIMSEHGFNDLLSL